MIMSVKYKNFMQRLGVVTCRKLSGFERGIVFTKNKHTIYHSSSFCAYCQPTPNWSGFSRIGSLRAIPASQRKSTMPIIGHSIDSTFSFRVQENTEELSHSRSSMRWSTDGFRNASPSEFSFCSILLPCVLPQEHYSERYFPVNVTDSGPNQKGTSWGT